MSIPPQILFVDDDLLTAETFADLVRQTTQFSTIACSSSTDALKIVSSEPIAVVVLDQMMPDGPGTELFARLRGERENIKAIMLSGEAGRTDVAQAMELGYVADVRKDALDALVPAVLRAYSLYVRDTATVRAERELLLSKGLNLPGFPRVEYWLDMVEVVGVPFVPESEWDLLVQVNAGQSIAIEKEVTVGREVTLEKSYDLGLTGDGGIKVSTFFGFEGKIGSYVKRNTKNTVKETASIKRIVRETYSLPPEPVDPTVSAVKARGFYAGPEFVKVRVRIAVQHYPYKDSKYVWIDTIMHTGRFGTRQVDILTDNSRHIRNTNMI